MSDDSKSQPRAASSTQPSRLRRNGVMSRMVRATVRFVLLVAVPLTVAIVGLEMYVASGKIVNTENAYVKSEKIAISADVSGRVSELGVRAHAKVNKGQLLFVLEQRPFEIELAKAEAQLGVVENDIRGYQAAYRMEVAALQMADDDLGFYQREYDRQKKLSSGGIVSKASHDQSQHNLQQARQRISHIQEQIGNAQARLGGDPGLPVQSHPRYLQAIAERDAAMLQLEKTVVRAPVSGVLGSIELQAGEHVEDGQPVFSIVADERIWIAANLKETQLTHVLEGQQVKITADTYPDRTFAAVVETIAPATGAEFSLLPPQNASGNWVKVVQRIPVYMTLLDPPADTPLRAGMSVTAEISTGREREMPAYLEQFMAFVQSAKGHVFASAMAKP
jgi:membrane fusion protein, multidrug efflux system